MVRRLLEKNWSEEIFPLYDDRYEGYTEQSPFSDIICMGLSDVGIIVNRTE